jgi:SH3-like domain-containing protein
MKPMCMLTRVLALLLMGCLLGQGASAQEAGPASAPVVVPSVVPVPMPDVPIDALEVTEPYIELRTGPGRGFPVAIVVQRHERIVIELRHTDWYRVRTDRGRVGWVLRHQLDTTLTASGARKTFRDILVDDFLLRRAQFGAGWGRFHGEPSLKLWGSYRLSDTLSLEASMGQVQGTYSGVDQWHVDLLAEPWSDQSWSPFVSVGVGRYKDVPNATLVGVTTVKANQSHVAVGLNFHLSERFIVRADYGLHTVFFSDSITTEFRAWSIGVGFFF